MGHSKKTKDIHNTELDSSITVKMGDRKLPPIYVFAERLIIKIKAKVADRAALFFG